MDLRDALRMLRSEAGLTQVEFAAAVYVSFSTVNRWENKGMRPNKLQSKAILELAKQRRVSTPCLDALTRCLLAPRVDDKEDRENMRRASERIKLEQRDLLTAEQFRKTMDNIDMALIGQRFYGRDPASCDIFYHNSFFIKSLGYTPDEFEYSIRRDAYFAIAPESRGELARQIGDLLSHKIDACDFSVIAKAVRKDRSTLWLEIKAASLTEYSYGQEVFTSCRDVTRRVEAERRYKEEVMLRDASMLVMFSNVHCDLTENRISRHHNLSAMLGREYNGETIDQLLQIIADAAPDGAEKSGFLKVFNRDALLRAYDRGDVYGNAVLYNRNTQRWFRNEYLVVKNPVSGNIHALIYIFDIQKQVLSDSMLGIIFNQFFDFVGLIDVVSETVEPYYYADGVFNERHPGKRRYPETCAEKLRLYGYDESRDAESAAIALSTVLRQLDSSDFYSTVLCLKGYDGKPLRKKVSYTYLDGNRSTIIMAQSDQDMLKRFMLMQKSGSPAAGNGKQAVYRPFGTVKGRLERKHGQM